MADDNQRVDVIHGKQAQAHIKVIFAQFRGQPISIRFLKGRYLKRIGNDVAMRDHDAFLHTSNAAVSSSPLSPSALTEDETHRKPGSPTRIAQKRRLPRALPSFPLERLERRQLAALCNQVVDSFELF